MISIIIPMYNSFQMMRRLLKSLESQENKDFELIVVDDKSTDNSFACMEAYCKRTSLDIQVFQLSSNNGPGAARNYGITKCKGEYLTFADSDDYFDISFLQEINKIIQDRKPDVIMFDFYMVRGKRKYKREMLLHGKEGFANKRHAMIYCGFSTCCKVYKTSIIKEHHICFLNQYIAEDMPFCKVAFAHSNTFYNCKKPLYYYVMQRNSLMHNRGKIHTADERRAFCYLEKKLKEEFPYEVEAAFTLLVLYSGVLSKILSGWNNKKIKKYIALCEKEYPNCYNNEVVKTTGLVHRVCLYLIKKRLLLLLRFITFIKEI